MSTRPSNKRRAKNASQLDGSKRGGGRNQRGRAAIQESSDSEQGASNHTPELTDGSLTSPSGINLDTSEAGGDGEDTISSLQSKSIQRDSIEVKLREMEERMKSMEARAARDRREGDDGSIVTAISAPENDVIMKENLRRFVSAKVFPSWKFIFKKDLLDKCVYAAVSKNYITLPPGFTQGQLADRYSKVVRTSLDGCRSNAQAAARKRYLGK